MANYFRPNIAALDGYVPGEQPHDQNVIKLNTNENPYSPSPKVRLAVRRALDASLRLYPEPLSNSLRSVAAKVYGVGSRNIIAGNGSDELLSMIMRCFIGPDDRVAYPTPTYSLYETLIDIQGGKRAPVAFHSDFSVPAALHQQNAAVTFLCNPNSPSGTLVSLSDIEALARTVTGILVVDEAYVDFATSEGASAIPLIRSMPNLIVLRTFSKSFSLAGMRIGLAFAAEDIIAGMMKVKDSYNLNRLSLIAGTAALGDMPWMHRNAQRIQRTRDKLTAGLRKLDYEVYPSHANFVLARRRGESQQAVYQWLKDHQIFVRFFDAPGLQDCLRITVGRPNEVRALIDHLRSYSSRQP